MIRATVASAMMLTAAIAVALTPVQCLGQTATPATPPNLTPPLPAKATKELPRDLLALIKQKKMPKSSPVLMRIFKEDAELEVLEAGQYRRLPVPQDLSDLPLVGRYRAEGA